MESQVSGYLSQAMAPVIQECFVEPTLRRSFSSSLPLMTEINKAHVLMLVRQGIITREVGQKLAQGILELEREGEPAFDLNPELEDPYFNYEAKIIERLGSDVGGRMHIARSRNDLKSVQDRLRARNLALDIQRDLLILRETIVAQATHHKGVVMPGYTHLQPAQPITFGFYLLGIVHALERDYRRIAECYARINLSPLGAGAFAGTSFPIDRAATASYLGFDGVTAHAQDSVASRDCIVELLSHATLLAGTIGRMAQDFYVMTTYEFQTLRFPDSIAITSSIMPQKKNMAVLENLKGRVAQLLGALVTFIAAYKATPFTHIQDGNQDGFRWAWDALADMALALPVCRLVVESAEPQEARMLELARANFSTATDLADTLVRTAGLSFRDAHHVVGRVVRLALDHGFKSDEITVDLLQDAARSVLGRTVAVDAAAVRDSLDPVRAVEGRVGSGGPSSKDMEVMTLNITRRIAQDRAELDARAGRTAAAHREMEAAFAALARGELRS